jgi:hypothetical protein
MRSMLGVAVMVLTCGCSSVFTTQPIGETPWNIAANADAWEGTWNHAEGAIRVVVVDGSNGLIRIGWVEKSGKKLKCESGVVYLREAGEWAFANFQGDEWDEKDRYLWGRIERKDRVALVWGPVVDKFRQLVAEGRLPGVTNVLSALSSNHLQLITSESEGFLFNWAEPMVFWKTAD